MDYYCFPTITGDLSVFLDLDQYTNSNERGFYERTQKSVMLAKKQGKLLLYDLRTKTFIDSDGKTVNIKGKEIFPRCKIQESEELLNAIEKNGGNSIVSYNDSKMIENWFKYIKIKRKFIQTTFGALKQHLNFYDLNYGNHFFMKTVKKQFSNKCGIITVFDEPNLYAFANNRMYSVNGLISDDSTVLVTDTLSIVHDDYGEREWRVFVVKNKILCISRKSDDLVEIDPSTVEKIQHMINRISQIADFPSSYSVDFFEYYDPADEDEVIFDICEFNSIEASGVYRNNDLVC